MPPIELPAELREHSRRYREAARKTGDAAMKRQLAAHAAALAQIAEAIERVAEVIEHEGGPAEGAKIERYKAILSEALAERVQKIVRGLLRERQAVAAQSQIKAWRLRAEELRATADQFVVPSAQESLWRAAANYDQLADHAEALLQERPEARGDKAG